MPFNKTAIPNRPPTPHIILSKKGQNHFRPPASDEIFNSLGNSQRRLIFELLCRNELPIEDLIVVTYGHYQNIRKHLTILESNQLITSFKDGKHRYYHANQKALINLYAWIASVQANLAHLS